MFKICPHRAIEMVDWLRTLAAIVEDPSSVPSTHMTVHNCNLSSQGSDTLFWPLWTPGTKGCSDMHVGKAYIIYVIKVTLKNN